MTKKTFKLTPFFVLSLMFLALFGCSGKSEYSIKANEEVSYNIKSFSFSQEDYPFDYLPEYKISPGDILDVLFQIRTWEKEEKFNIGIDNIITVKFVYAPELNTTQQVLPDGNITMPMIGRINVFGRSIEKLNTELTEKYSHILKNPDLYITIENSRAGIQELKKDLHTAPRGLSRLVTVRPDGYVTFPMVGDLQVAGKTFDNVTKTLNKKYENVLSGLHVDLFLEKHSGSKLYVLGQVAKPGVYDIAKPLTVEQALAIAGSYNSKARLDNIIVLRKNENKIVAAKIDLTQSFSKNSDHEFFYLIPDDVVYVPQRKLSKVAEIMKDISDVLLFRGWDIGLDVQLYDRALIRSGGGR